jgi:hypothetical protein
MLCPEPGAAVRRREFIRLLSGAAVAWPLATRAQQTARVPRIGYLAPTSDAGALNDSFRKGCASLVMRREITLSSNTGPPREDLTGFAISRRNWSH